MERRGLGTVLNAASTSNQRAYDSKAVTYLLLDEQGKTTRDNVNARWDKPKKVSYRGGYNKRIFHTPHHCGGDG